MAVTIPDTHQDLLVEPVHGVLATMMPDGQPQSSMVWADYDGEHVLISTTLERQKGQNMQANPKVTLLVIDPKNASRWLEVRGTVVEIVEDAGEAFVDKLTRLYSDNRRQHYYGDIFPVEQRQKETRVIVKIQPVKISLDAIFK
jgi:PPOX class probable F420-dependent enzyme